MVTRTTEHLLTARQMAQFAVDGFLEFGDVVPTDLNAAVHGDALRYPKDRGWDPNHRREFWDFSAAVREVFDLPSVQGIVQSLVGPAPRHDHSYLHKVSPGRDEAQVWHVDFALAADHPRTFDILVCYFPHDAPAEMGPTMILPGSHMRRVNYDDVTRYKNFVGQRQLTGPGGRIAFLHESMWHCAQPNRTERWRFMFKIRYGPQVPQQGHFDTEGWDADEIEAFFNAAEYRHPWGDSSKIACEQWRSWWPYIAGAA